MKRFADQTLYEILEVGADAAATDIERAYERVRTLYGPGSLATYTLMSSEDAAVLVRRIEEARSVLLDPAARAQYDASLAAPQPAAPPPNGAHAAGSNGAAGLPPWSDALPPVIPALVPPPAPAGPPEAVDEPAAQDEAAAPVTVVPPVEIVPPVAIVPPPAEVPPAAEPQAPEPAVAAPPVEPRPAEPPPPAPAILLSRAAAAAGPVGPAPIPPAPPRPILLDRQVGAPAPASPVPTDLVIPEGAAWSGDVLRRVREARGISIAQISERTKVTRHHIENIEGERFGQLPAAVYLRGILLALARELRLDGQKVARSYLERIAAGGGAPPGDTSKR